MPSPSAKRAAGCTFFSYGHHPSSPIEAKMGDLSSGFAYLCCCVKHADVDGNGSRFGSGKKPDPREREIDEVFLSRNYHQDSMGHFHIQPTPTSSMLPARQLSDQSKKSAASDEKKPKNKKSFIDPMSQPQNLGLPPPPLALADSTSTGPKEMGVDDATGTPELLITPATA